MKARSTDSAAPVIILCGFMGTGKSAAGRVLAELLGVPFLDTDSIVEAQAGATVAEIFARDGEARFRDLEAAACTALDVGGGAVVATGGGALLDPRTFDALSSRGTLVLLEASLGAILRRTAGDPTRPRLPRGADGSVDAARTVTLMNERRPAYHRVARRIDTTHRSPEDVAFEIAEQLRHPHRIIHVRGDVRPVPGHVLRDGEARLSRVVVGRGALAHTGAWLREVGVAGTVFVMSSRRVAGHHGASLKAVLEKERIAHHFIAVDDAEDAKSIEQAERLLYELMDADATRDGAVVSLGGGVIGDLAGFVAATYLRGMPFVQIPTTLLAQIDASIGGKVGVNHPRAKNLIGAIYQPQVVISDADLLTTLDDRNLASGMAEVVKTAIIGAPELFTRLVARADEGVPFLRDAVLLDECIAGCATIKALIVEKDPYEHDQRRVLNLGHTLGHALEQATGYGTMTHGEAVGLGLLTAIRVSMGRKLATRDFLNATRGILAACGLPVETPEVDVDAVRRALGADKKRRVTGLTFVLPIAPGDVRIQSDVTEDEIIASMRDA